MMNDDTFARIYMHCPNMVPMFQIMEDHTHYTHNGFVREFKAGQTFYLEDYSTMVTLPDGNRYARTLIPLSKILFMEYADLNKINEMRKSLNLHRL